MRRQGNYNILGGDLSPCAGTTELQRQDSLGKLERLLSMLYMLCTEKEQIGFVRLVFFKSTL